MRKYKAYDGTSDEDRIMSEIEVRQGEAWPSFGECEGVFSKTTRSRVSGCIQAG